MTDFQNMMQFRTHGLAWNRFMDMPFKINERLPEGTIELSERDLCYYFSPENAQERMNLMGSRMYAEFDHNKYLLMGLVSPYGG